MKRKIRYTLFLSLFFLGFIDGLSQDALAFKSGSYEFNPDKLPCLTDTERAKVVFKLQQSQALLKNQGKLAPINARIPNPLFIWPVKKSAASTYNEIWSVSNYVDHNTAFPDQITDYNGGTHSYDTSGGYNHQGVDVFIWPFPWNNMDTDTAEIIAASSGQIISKIDGNFDRNCSFDGSQWNAVYIRHNDGSVAWYGHMKNGSLTTKNIGDMVAQGEYLGIVGSSGNSTGPHLHFEIYEDDTTYAYDKLIDPYAGPSNAWNTTSWWASQKSYRNPAINAATTHSADPNFGSCPNPAITNEQNNFALNDMVYFIVFLKDAPVNSNVNFRMYRPDNSLAYDENTTISTFFSASWWRWSRPVDAEGAWRFVATFNGESVTHNFNVGTLSVDENSLASASIYPNPSEGIINISSNSMITKIIVNDVHGKKIDIIEQSDNIKKIDVSWLSNGLYFLTLEDAIKAKKTIKLIKT